LEFTEKLFLLAHFARLNLSVNAESSKQARGFTDVPFDGVQTVTTVADVGGTDVFARRQKVYHANRDQRAQRNLERQRGNVEIILAGGGGMKIDAVGADADGVGELLCGFFGGTRVGADVVFGDGEEGFNPAGFAE